MEDSTEETDTFPDPNEFESADADIDPRLKKRSLVARTLAQNGFSNVLILSRERAEDVFHSRRIEIIDYLKENDPDSVRALAEALDYDKGVVSRDLARLAQAQVVTYETEGARKAPRLRFQHVLIEPVV